MNEHLNQAQHNADFLEALCLKNLDIIRNYLHTKGLNI